MKTLKPFTAEQPPQWLLAFDFDGTMVNPEMCPSVDPEFFSYVQHLRETEQACWVINTGRSLMHVLEGMAQAKVPFLPDYLIVRERDIYCPNSVGRFVPNDGWNKPCEKAHNRLFRKHRRLMKEIRRFVDMETAAVWGIQEGEPDGLIASTLDEMEQLLSFINHTTESAEKLSYQRNGIYLRFSHADYHKGTAMREVARQLGLSPQNTFAIGDSFNDIDMLDSAMAVHTACPSNAVPEVKKHVSEGGGYVAKEAASRGVIESLEQLFDRRADPSASIECSA